ncbi:DUF192 domain-containing protein [Aquamicrobium terrae]
MTARRWSSVAGALAWLAVLVSAPPPSFAQNSGDAVQQPMLLPVDPEPLVIATKAGPRSFTIEVAADASERAAGLMHRQSMPDDRGMLFVFEETRPVSFWMKNTPMPLDLVFIAENGRIEAVLPGEPYSIAPISPGKPARYVLELKAGTAEREGIAEGDVVNHPRVTASGSGQSSSGG